MTRELRNAALILLGVLSAGMGLKGFLLSSNFIDGGVTGISMLVAKTTGVPLAVLLPVINLPFVAVGYRHMGRAFAVRSVLGIAALAAVLATMCFSLPEIARAQTAEDYNKGASRPIFAAMSAPPRA